MSKLCKQLLLLSFLAAPFYIMAVTVTGPVTASQTLQVNGTLSKGAGSFVIDHPVDPRNKLLYHSFVESPDMKNLYDGIATLNSQGESVIELPSYFMALNTEYRYQFTPHGQAMPNLHIKEEIADNRFKLAGGVPGGTVSWQVTGTRQDAYSRFNPIVVEVEKGPKALVKKGEYLFPELYEN